MRRCASSRWRRSSHHRPLCRSLLSLWNSLYFSIYLCIACQTHLSSYISSLPFIILTVILTSLIFYLTTALTRFFHHTLTPRLPDPSITPLCFSTTFHCLACNIFFRIFYHHSARQIPPSSSYVSLPPSIAAIVTSKTLIPYNPFSKPSCSS